jgi:hypothetical protein
VSKSRSRQFRPTLPRLTKSWPVVVFGLLTILAAVGWVREGAAAPFLVSFAMMLGASWLHYRIRVFGSPTLDVDSSGLRYRIGRRDVAAKWTEIENVGWDFYRDEILFYRRGGERPIRVSIDMTTRDGERFDNLVEDYWNPPTGRRTACR